MRLLPLLPVLIGWLAGFGSGGAAFAQVNTNQTTFQILTNSDGGICQPQAGAYWTSSDTGCCGGPGRRKCASGGACISPATVNSTTLGCELPAVVPFRNNLPAKRPSPAGTDIAFFVASDLHFYRDIYNVGDQTAVPYIMNQYAAANQNNNYRAVLLAGDLLTDRLSQELYPYYPARLDGYRLLWENGQFETTSNTTLPNATGWIPGASIGFPTFPTLGNHDTAAGNPVLWGYLATITQNMNVDRNHTGCLVNVDTGCTDEGLNGGSLNYSFDWEGVHFLMLNTWPGDQLQYIPPNGSAGLTWLKNDLVRFVGASGKPVVIVQHYGINDIYDPLYAGNFYWSDQNAADFESALAPYNVVAWFSGHSHQLGMFGKKNTINTDHPEPNYGIGNTLDNFMDGAAGECQNNGDGKTSIGTVPASSTYCAHGVSNFFAVQVNDRYMTVNTVSFSDSKLPYPDNTIPHMAGTDANTTSSCIKRITPVYTDVSGSVKLHATGSEIMVTNTSSSDLAGPLAIFVDGELAKWDFVDSCNGGSGGSAHKFLLLTETGFLRAGAQMSVAYSRGQQDFTDKNLHLYQLSDTLVVSPAVPAVGADPVTVSVGMTSGATVPFTYRVNPTALPFQQTWLTVTASSGKLPATLTLTNTQPAGYTDLKQVIQIQPLVSGVPITDVTVFLKEGVLSLSSNIPGATAQAFDPSSCLSASCSNPLPLPASFATLSARAIAEVPPPAPAGARYTFHGWSDGGAATHDVQVPLTGYTLIERYDTAYLVTPAVSAGGSVTISPASPKGDGYYVSGTTVTVTATPDPSYLFTGFNGLPNNTNPQTLTVSGPATIGATFEANAITFATNVPAAEGSTLGINCNSFGVCRPVNPPDVEQLTAGTSVNVSAPVSFVSSTNSAFHYVFSNWSDGVTTPTRTIVVPGSPTTYQAIYSMTITFTSNVPAAAGSTIGIGCNSFGVCRGSNAPPTYQQLVPGSTLAVFSPEAFGSLTNPGVQYVFAGWSDGVMTQYRTITGPGAPTTYQALYTTQVLVTVSVSPAAGGIVTGGGWVELTNGTGSTTLTAAASNGYYFKGYSGSITASAATLKLANVSSPLNITALFAADPAITITSNPPGLTLTVDNAPIVTPQTYTTWAKGTTHIVSAGLPATTQAGVRAAFNKWEDGGSVSRTYTVPATITTLTADFDMSYLLSLSASGPGAIAGSPASPTADGYFPASASVTVTATANPGNALTGFSGDLTGSANPQTIVMTRPASVTATFASNQTPVTFSTNVPPSEGSLITVGGVTHPSTAFTTQLTAGTAYPVSVPASFISSTNPGIQYVFVNWTDGGLTAARTIVAPVSPVSYEAVYKTQVLLTIAVTPAAGGTVSGGGWVGVNGRPTLTASSAAGYYFKDFTSAGFTIAASPARIPTLSQPLTVTAEFAANPAITITSNPTGSIVYVDNAAVVAPQTFSWTPGATHTLDASKTATGVAGTHQLFANWADGSAASYTYVVPATSGTLTASFNLSYLLSLVANGPGSVAATPGSPTGDGYYPASANITVTATPNANSSLTGFSGSLSGVTNPQTIAMTAPESVTATFTANASTQPTLTFSTNVAGSEGQAIAVNSIAHLNTGSIALPFAPGATVLVQIPPNFVSATNAGIQYVFLNWADGVTTATRTITAPSSSTSYQAVYKTQVLLTLTVTPASAGTVTGGGWIDAGGNPTLAATSASGFYFRDFTSANFTNSANPLKIAAGSQPFTVTAEFAANPVITVTSNPTGLVVIVDNAPVTTPQTYTTWTPGSTHTLDASRTATGVAGARQTFVNWDDGSPVSHTFTVPTTAAGLTANFNLSYLLSLASSGPGSISAAPPGPTGDGYYPASASVTVTASPNPNSYLSGFSGALSGTANPQTVTMTAPTSVTAAFAASPVTTIQSGTAGTSATIDGVSSPLPAQLAWAPGTTHTVAFPSPQAGSPGQQFVFAGWSDGSNSNPRQITAGSAASHTGNFTTQYLVSTTAAPVAAGSVTGGGWYNAGSPAVLTATASGGYEFTGFSGAIGAARSPQTVSVNGPLSAVASFVAAPPHIIVGASTVNDSDPNTVQLGLLLNNTGLGTAAQLQVDSLTATLVTGTGTVSVVAVPPVTLSLPGGQSVSLPVSFNWPGTATRIRLTVHFTADNGTYQGSQVLNLFR